MPLPERIQYTDCFLNSLKLAYKKTQPLFIYSFSQHEKMLQEGNLRLGFYPYILLFKIQYIILIKTLYILQLI